MNPLIAYITDQTISDCLILSEQYIEGKVVVIEETNHIMTSVDIFETFETVVFGLI